jgi:single-strand DNA-binding protein
MNHVTIAGNLGADPEVRFTPSGQKVTTFRVAARVRRSSKDKDETIWWRVTVWGEQFDKLIGYLKKGSAVVVVGDMSKPEIYNDREGKPQVSMNLTAFSISFSPFGRPEHSSDSNSENKATAMQEPAFAGAEQPAFGQNAIDVSFSEDDIPF